MRRLQVRKPDYIFLLGEMIDGPNRRGSGKETVTRNLNEQGACSLSLLRMIPRKSTTKILGLLGSGYHDEQYFNVNQGIVESLGGQFKGATTIVTINGHSMRLHHGSTAAYIYIEMIMGRRRMFAQEQIARGKLPPFEAIICGHSHRSLYIRTSWRDGKKFHVVLCPGWEGQTEFMAMKDPDKMIPEVGAVIATITKDRLDFEELLYPTPLGFSEPVKL